MDNVHKAFVALVPLIRLPLLRSIMLRPPRPSSLRRSWMDTGWMTGWLRSSSGASEPVSQLSSGSRSIVVNFWPCWVMVVSDGGCEEPSLKWVCSRELMYSVTLGGETEREIKKLRYKCLTSKLF